MQKNFRERAYVHAQNMMAYLLKHDAGFTMIQHITKHEIMDELVNLVDLADNDGTFGQIQESFQILEILFLKLNYSR